jgi:hypothetical protein
MQGGEETKVENISIFTSVSFGFDIIPGPPELILRVLSLGKVSANKFPNSLNS